MTLMRTLMIILMMTFILMIMINLIFLIKINLLLKFILLIIELNFVICFYY
jgi:hypothetical protein